jgi:hypothetical protein
MSGVGELAWDLARLIGLALGLMALVVGLSTACPPDHTWQRVAGYSDLRPEVTWDSVGRRPIFRVFLPDSFDNFDPDVLWGAWVSGCDSLPTAPARNVCWRVDTAGRSLGHGHLVTPTIPDEFAIGYGDLPPGWNVTQYARPLEEGRCYFVTIRIDNRAAKAAFTFENGTVRYRRHGLPVRDQAECHRLVDGDTARPAIDSLGTE